MGGPASPKTKLSIVPLMHALNNVPDTGPGKDTNQEQAFGDGTYNWFILLYLYGSHSWHAAIGFKSVWAGPQQAVKALRNSHSFGNKLEWHRQGWQKGDL